MRLKDADVLLERVDKEREYLVARGQLGAEHILVKNFRDLIEEVPTIEPDQLLNAVRPKGKWLRDKDGFYCSGCGARAAKDNYLMELRTNFCPCCGIDLRGEN